MLTYVLNPEHVNTTAIVGNVLESVRYFSLISQRAGVL